MRARWQRSMGGRLYFLVIIQQWLHQNVRFSTSGVFTAATYALEELLMRTKFQVCVSVICNNREVSAYAHLIIYHI